MVSRVGQNRIKIETCGNGTTYRQLKKKLGEAGAGLFNLSVGWQKKKKTGRAGRPPEHRAWKAQILSNTPVNWKFFLAEWLRPLTWVQKVPGSSPGSDIWCSCHTFWEVRGGHGYRVGAKLTVEAQVVKAENTISVGHCVIPLGKGLVPHCSVVRMGL